MARIIYIKHPSQGSHFRTIGGSSGGGGGGGGGGGSNPRPPKPPKVPRVKPPKNRPPGTWTGTGGALYGSPASNWFIHPPSSPNYGSSPSGVNWATGPYEQPLTPAFQPTQTLWGDFYLISQGVDPATGDIIAPFGTPGTLMPFAGTVLDGTLEATDTGKLRGNPNKFGYSTGTSGYGKAVKRDAWGNPVNANLWPKLPTAYWGQSPNANKPRPWWAK